MPILTALSSSGTGKTTNLSSIAYCIGALGYRVALIELDSRNSLKTCCGVEPVDPPHSTSVIFQHDFAGDYPWISIWSNKLAGRVKLLQASRRAQIETEKLLNVDSTGIYKLRRILKEHPIDAELIILDCPGREGILTDAAIVAASHIILAIEPTQKCFEDVNAFLEHLSEFARDSIDIASVVGFMVGKFNLRGSFQRQGVEQLFNIATKLDLKLFNPIRYSPTFESAYAAGQPIGLYAPSSGGALDFLQEGNFFKRQHKSLKAFDRKFKKLPALVPYLCQLIEEEKYAKN